MASFSFCIPSLCCEDRDVFRFLFTLGSKEEHLRFLRVPFGTEASSFMLGATIVQRNKCVKLLRKAKFDYYQNINLGNLTDNRKFWKTVKPIFSDKVQVNSSLTLIENGRMISNDSEIAEIFNHHFATITDSLGISINESVLLPTDDILDSVDKAVRKYDAHPSICKIRENVKIANKFEFSEVSTSDIATQIKQLNSKKASPVDSIPARILRKILTYLVLFSNFCLTHICLNPLFRKN